MATVHTTLRPGAFFGETGHRLVTPSFSFSEMRATQPEVPRHTHESAHFVLVVRGVYLSAAFRDEEPCGPATLVFNPSGTTHRDRFRESEGRFLTITVASDVAARIERHVPAPIAFSTAAIASTIHRLYAEFHARSEFSGMMMEGLGLELAAQAGLFPRHPDRRPPLWLQTAREAIEDGCTQNLTMQEVARAAAVHPIHLARTFRQYFHCSPGEYLRQCRLQRVQRLLIDSKMPLAELSLHAGFSDQSQLSRAFRQFSGMAPGAYRRAFGKIGES